MPALGANSGELALYGAVGLAMALPGAGLALLSDRKGCPGPGPRQWHCCLFLFQIGENKKQKKFLTHNCDRCYRCDMKSCNIRNVPDLVMLRMKAQAAQEGLTLRAWVLKVLDSASIAALVTPEVLKRVENGIKFEDQFGEASEGVRGVRRKLDNRRQVAESIAESPVVS
jgi:hypothetical protein